MSDSPPKPASDSLSPRAAETPNEAAKSTPPAEAAGATSADVKPAASPTAMDDAAKAMDAAAAKTAATESGALLPATATESAPPAPATATTAAPATATVSSPPLPAEMPSPQLNLAALPATTSGMHQQYVAPGVQRQSFLASNGKLMLALGVAILLGGVWAVRGATDATSDLSGGAGSTDTTSGTPQPTASVNAGMAGFDPNRTPQPDFTVNAGEVGDTLKPKLRADAGNKGGYAQEQTDLAAARAMINTDPMKALAMVDQHDVDYPRGILDPEARVIRVEAWVKKGDDAKALALGNAFLEDYPHSPGAGRVQAIVEAIKNKQPQQQP